MTADLLTLDDIATMHRCSIRHGLADVPPMLDFYDELLKFGDIAVFTEDKDLGDSSEEYVKNLIKEYKR